MTVVTPLDLGRVDRVDSAVRYPGSKRAGSVKHYIQYHNADKVGYGCSGIDPDPLSIVTSKSVPDIRGEVVWLLCGEGKPRRYGICARFVVTAIESTPGEQTTVSGEGTLLSAEVPLNDEPWFKQFLNDYQNFSLGFRELKEREYIDRFESLFASKSGEKGRSGRGSSPPRVKGGATRSKLGEPTRAEAKALLSHLPEDGSTTSNAQTTERLSGDEERHPATKDSPSEKGVIAVNSGRGGIVSHVSEKRSSTNVNAQGEEPRAPLPSSVGGVRQAASTAKDETTIPRGDASIVRDAPLEIFVDCSSKDERWRKKVEDDLKFISKNERINYWFTTEIIPGDERQKKIDEKLSQAQLVLLLVSRDFLGADSHHSLVIEKAMSQSKAGKARVIPIILSSCDWKKTLFAELQPLPDDGKPIEHWSKRDKALLNIQQGIRRAIEKLRGTSHRPETE